MRKRNEEPWDASRGNGGYDEANDPNRTVPLDADATEVLSDQHRGPIDEDRTEVLDGGRTQALPTDDQRTQVLDHGSWGSATADDANATRPLPAYGEGSSSPSAHKASGLEYDDAASEPRTFAPTEYREDDRRQPQARQQGAPAEAPGQFGGQPAPSGGPSGAELRSAVVRRQKAEYGRLQLLPGLLGWIVATALVGFLTWLAGALAPVAAGTQAPSHVGDTVSNLVQGAGSGAAWAAAFALIFFVSYLVGGYAAGRAGRFSGVKQGVAVWLWQLMGTAVSTVLTLFLGARMGDSVPLGSVQALGGSQFGWGIAAAACVLVIGLVGAVLGGLWGTRFHRTVDRWGFEGR